MSIQIPKFTFLSNVDNSLPTLRVRDSNGYTAVVLSADSSILISGAPGTGTSDVGAAYLLNRSSVTDSWEYVQTLAAPISDANLNYGQSIAITNTNDVIAGGATGARGGIVFLHKKNPFTNNWNYFQFLQGSGIVSSLNTAIFGSDVSFTADGNYLAVGASGSNFAYIYASNTNGRYTEQQKITSPEAGPILFGTSTHFSPDGNYLMVGAPDYDYPGGATNRGMSFMYKKDTDTANWSLVQNISTPLITTNGFGDKCSLSYDGTYALVGCSVRSSFFLKKTAGSDFWTSVQGFGTSDNLAGGFLASLSYTGEYAAIGNKRLPNGGGFHYFQKRPNTDNWLNISTIQFPNRVGFQGISGMISQDGTYITVGFSNSLSSDFGAFYVYYRDWTSFMPSTNTLSLISLASTSRNTVVLPKASSITAPMAWLKDTTPNRIFYNLLTISTSYGDRLDSTNFSINLCNAGLGVQFAQDRLSNWYTLNYYDGK